MKKYINLNNLKNISFAAHFFVACFATANQEQDRKQTFFKEPLTHYVKRGWHNTGGYNKGITFFKDAEGKDFVLKYQDTITAINETLAANMRASIGVPANQVVLLPKDTLFMKKPLQHTATLHTQAPGKAIRDIQNMPYYVDIKDGLSKKINLQSISESDDLCRNVAANLYDDNKDGSRANLFFTQETNSFCAIDLGNSFHDAHSIFDKKDLPKNLLATKACSFVEKLRAKKLSPQQTKALTCVDETLDKLIEKYPPNKLYDEWMNVAQQANYTYSPQRKEYIKKLIHYNYSEIQRLRSHIDCAIEAQNIPYTLRSMAEPSKKAQRNFWQIMNS